MATVEGKTSIKIDELVNGTVISGYVNPTTGQLVLVTRGGAEILAGFAVGVAAVEAGTYISVDYTDPAHPVVNAMVPMTTLNSSGLPEIVFDSDGHIVYTEAP